jgi:hypothetical protein
MRCPSCTAENAAARRFCAECGKPLPSPCPACGFENELTARFCGGCGLIVGGLIDAGPAQRDNVVGSAPAKPAALDAAAPR